MDNVEVGDECIIGALTFVPAEMIIPKRKIVVGNPGKIVKDVSDSMIDWKTQGTKLYQQLPYECQTTLKACEPLDRMPAFRPEQQDIYKTWANQKTAKKEQKQDLISKLKPAKSAKKKK